MHNLLHFFYFHKIMLVFFIKESNVKISLFEILPWTAYHCVVTNRSCLGKITSNTLNQTKVANMKAKLIDGVHLWCELLWCMKCNSCVSDKCLKMSKHFSFQSPEILKAPDLLRGKTWMLESSIQQFLMLDTCWNVEYWIPVFNSSNVTFLAI